MKHDNRRLSLTRRESLTGIALAGCTALVPLAGAAAVNAAEPEETVEEMTPDQREAQGRELAYLEMARAWLDRWQAIGGNFALSWNADGSFRSVLRGMPMPYTWTPTDEGNEKLPPHVWLTREEHHEGAVKALEAMLILSPGLRAAVWEIGTALALSGAPQPKMDISGFLAKRRVK
jgi:hypothetical protein